MNKSGELLFVDSLVKVVHRQKPKVNLAFADLEIQRDVKFRKEGCSVLASPVQDDQDVFDSDEPYLYYEKREGVVFSAND
jgi:hypothetical protein